MAEEAVAMTVDEMGVIVTLELTLGFPGSVVVVGPIAKFCGGSGINPLKLAKISATLRRSV